MGYIENNLASGEHVIYKAKVHLLTFVPSIIWFWIAIALVGTKNQEINSTAVLGAFVFLYSLYLGLKALLRLLSTELAITNKRIIAKVGLIRSKSIELNHHMVESVTVNQWLLGRLLSYGTLVIRGSGGGLTPIGGISQPMRFKKAALEAIDDQSKKS